MSQDIPKKAYELGNEYEKVYKGCSQCSLAALQDAFGLPNPDVFKASTGLAAGCGGVIDGNCGAYSGAILFLGSLTGRERDDFEDKAGRVFTNFQLVKELHDKFIEAYGSVICRDVQTKRFGRPYYLADTDDFVKFEAAGAHEVHCPDVVGKAAEWAAEIAIEHNLV